jgi:ankyrin repeat protein
MAAEEAVDAFLELVFQGVQGVVAEVRRSVDEDERLVKAHGHGGYTALMVAAGRGNLELVRLLLGLGAEIEARNEQGWTALLSALIGGQEAAVDWRAGGGGDCAARLRRRSSQC